MIDMLLSNVMSHCALTVIPPRNDQTCLATLLEEIVVAYSSMAQLGVRFYHSTGTDVPEFVNIDALRIRQVIANGVTNALKYTPSGEVRLHVRLGSLVVVVCC